MSIPDPCFDHRPSFLGGTNGASTFVDDGGSALSTDTLPLLCESYFYLRHNHAYNPNASPNEPRLDMLQHLNSPQFLQARALFLSEMEEENSPELVFLLWELYGPIPANFINMMRTLKVHQSTPGWVLSDIELLNRDTLFPGLDDLKACIDYAIKKVEAQNQQRGVFNLNPLVGLDFLKGLSSDMTQLKGAIEGLANTTTPAMSGLIEEFWGKDAPEHWIISPYEYGLNYLLYQELQNIDRSDTAVPLRIPETQTMINLPTAPVQGTALDDLNNEGSADDSDIRLLFGVHGCGKTKTIFDTLSSNWGLYILPGGQSESLAGRTLQSDSVLLWATITQVVTGLHKVCEQHEIRSTIDRLVDAFLACRLREFKKLYHKEYSRRTTTKEACRHWLQYQLTAAYEGDNNFERYFAIARHLPQRRICPHPGWPSVDQNDFPNWLPDEKFYFCLDEFQSDFDSLSKLHLVPEGHEYIAGDHGLMHDFLASVLEFGAWYKHERLQWKIDLAGTSSYLGQVTQKIKSWKPSIVQPESFYKIHSRFERIKDFQVELPQFLASHTHQILFEAWAIFKATRESRNAIYDSENSAELSKCLQSSAFLSTSGRHISDELQLALLNFFTKTAQDESKIYELSHLMQAFIHTNKARITQIGLPLRGRYIWSSRYSQNFFAKFIKSQLQTNDQDLETELEAQVTEIETQTIEELISNLIKLRETNRQTYSHVCRLTIRADALNKPTLFPDDYTGELVTLGFAYAECNPGSTEWHNGHVSIGEPLAIRAVLRYLDSDEEGKREFKRQADDMVYVGQDNGSVLGFNAEYFLAMNFDGVFRKRAEFVSIDRREAVLKYLGRSCSIITDKTIDPASPLATLNIQEFELLKPNMDDSDLGNKISMIDWLQQAFQGLHTSKFCYPSTAAGPDLAFVLDRTSGHVIRAPQINRILVTVQSKTAEQKTQNGFNVTETIHTVDPNLWYISSPTCEPATSSIVQSWGTDPSCLILSILVVSSDFVLPGADKICQSYRLEANRRLRCQQQHPPTTDPESVDKAEKLLQNLPNVDYAFCAMDRDMTKDLFGDTFTKLIDLTKKRPVKRQLTEQEAQSDPSEVSQAKRAKMDHRRVIHCSACKQAGHMKNNSKCPKFLQNKNRSRIPQMPQIV